MEKFTSCFVGIPLPERFVKDYQDLLGRVLKIAPSVEANHGQAPHITCFYLDEQSQENLPLIEKEVRECLKELKGAFLKVGGLDFFDHDSPRVFFLNIDYPSQLVEFNKCLDGCLGRFFTDDNKLPFHPHMTVARIWEGQAREEFLDKKEELQALLGGVNWEFPVEEVVIYGVDSTKSPQLQEKLISLAL